MPYEEFTQQLLKTTRNLHYDSFLLFTKFTFAETIALCFSRNQKSVFKKIQNRFNDYEMSHFCYAEEFKTIQTMAFKSFEAYKKNKQE